MITLSTPSVSHHLSLEEVIARFKASPRIDGIAEFGSRATRQSSASSDYDLLILVKDLPVHVFQMVTTIDGRLADIVLVEIEMVDGLLTAQQPPQNRSFESLFVQKMQVARILYDASERLNRIQHLVTGDAWLMKQKEQQAGSHVYAIWFWQSFGLLHLERMMQSQDPIHLSAADMMLTTCLSGTWRSYFEIRGIAWEGEKAAIRYWTTHDREYLDAIRQCLRIHDRHKRLIRYRKLVEQTLGPIGAVFKQGETAVILADSAGNHANVQRTLRYWNSLFNVYPSIS